MQTLTFNDIGLRSFRWSVALMLFLMGMSIVLESFSSLHDDEAPLGIAAGIFSILSLAPWYWIMTRICASLMDETIKKRIQWVFIPLLIESVLTILSYITKQDWLQLVGVITGLIGLAFYLSIGVRCIRYGDDSVRKFGNLLVYVSLLLNVVITCIFFGLIVTHEEYHRFIGPSSFLMAYCFVWPLQDALKTIKDMDTDMDM